jgi:hypothetical protein
MASNGSERVNDKVSIHGSNWHALPLAEGSPDYRSAHVMVSNDLNESGGSQEWNARDFGGYDKDGMNVTQNREPAFAEAKSWDENCRERKIGNSLGGKDVFH